LRPRRAETGAGSLYNIDAALAKQSTGSSGLERGRYGEQSWLNNAD